MNYEFICNSNTVLSAFHLNEKKNQLFWWEIKKKQRFPLEMFRKKKTPNTFRVFLFSRFYRKDWKCVYHLLEPDISLTGEQRESRDPHLTCFILARVLFAHLPFILSENLRSWNILWSIPRRLGVKEGLAYAPGLRFLKENTHLVTLLSFMRCCSIFSLQGA